VYAVEAAGRCFLIGVGEGPMSVLAELDAERVKGDLGAAAPVGFAEVLARALGRRPQPETTTSAGPAARAGAGNAPPQATIEPAAAPAERL
ncbi:MAG TPA: flagellar biosynthetic protein FliO, partial [Polyangia bacterium]|nr:flagellar biosynthetic protein FliO [Polyangia bacterium]